MYIEVRNLRHATTIATLSWTSVWGEFLFRAATQTSAVIQHNSFRMMRAVVFPVPFRSPPVTRADCDDRRFHQRGPPLPYRYHVEMWRRSLTERTQPVRPSMCTCAYSKMALIHPRITNRYSRLYICVYVVKFAVPFHQGGLSVCILTAELVHDERIHTSVRSTWRRKIFYRFWIIHKSYGNFYGPRGMALHGHESFAAALDSGCNDALKNFTGSWKILKVLIGRATIQNCTCSS